MESEATKHIHKWTTDFKNINAHDSYAQGVECECGEKLCDSDIEEFLNLPACQEIMAEYLGK